MQFVWNHLDERKKSERENDWIYSENRLLSLTRGPHTSPTLQPLNWQPLPAHSLSSSLSLMSPPELPLPLTPLSSTLSLSPSNPRSRSRIKVCMWYHCDHKLTSIPFLQFVCSFPKNLSRIWCLLVLGLKCEEHRISSSPELFPPFPPSIGGPQSW